MEGNSKVSIRTVDTDVVVLAIKTVEGLGITELWVAFGVCESFRLTAINDSTCTGSTTMHGTMVSLCSMPSLGLTQCLILGGKGKNSMESVDGI